MNSLVLDATDFNFIVMARHYASDLNREDLIFDYLNRGSRETHTRQTQQGIHLSPRGVNPPVNSTFSRCLASNFSAAETPAESLGRITTCVNESNRSLWTNPRNALGVRAQVCLSPSVVPREGIVELAPQAPVDNAHQECSRLADATTPLEYASTPSTLQAPVFSELQEQQMILVLQDFQREYEVALRAETNPQLPPDRQYKDSYHAASEDDPRELRDFNAQEFMRRVSPQIDQLSRDQRFFAERVSDFYATRIREGLSYPENNTQVPRPSLAPEETQIDRFIRGAGFPRLTLDLNSNTLPAHISSLFPDGQGARRAYTWYDIGVLTNSSGRLNAGILATGYWNRFDGNALLWSAGPQVSLRLSNIADGRTSLRAMALVGSYLNHPRGEVGNILVGGALDVMVNSYDTACNPLGPFLLTMPYIPHTSRCIDDDNYHPTVPTQISVAGLRVLVNTQTGNPEFFASVSIGGLLQALGVPRRHVSYGRGADTFLTLIGLFAEPRN